MPQKHKKHNIIYNHFSNIGHTSLLMTGCKMLEAQGIINLTINNCYNTERFPISNMAGAELIIDGIPSFFDCCDGYYIHKRMAALLDDYDFYFKRSFSEKENLQFGDNASKVYRLGLNYQVWYDSKQRKLFDSQNKNSPKSIAKKFSDAVLSQWKRPSSFEQAAYDIGNKTPKIIFMTRLWDEAADENELEYINSSRIDMLHRISKEYPNNSFCCVADNTVARKLCPELIAPPKDTIQMFYLKRMHSADICIGTMGLHKSIGWKTAEYVAASKAIVHEKMYYSVPGNFEHGKNYLQFSTTDECLENIEKLVNDKALLFEMKKNNESYYKRYVSPDKQILNAINIVTASH